MRCATWQMAHQSWRACAGAGKKLRWREMRRSELVTVPVFSPHPVAGNSTSAQAAVSVMASISDTTTRGHFSKAARALLASGMETTGLVAMIHTALMLPSSMALNKSTAFLPSWLAMVGLPQNRCTSARWSGLAISMWHASWLAKPPTSRPPMALGWPVMENGPMPALPMRPVSRWQLIMAATLSVPVED